MSIPASTPQIPGRVEIQALRLGAENKLTQLKGRCEELVNNIKSNTDKKVKITAIVVFAFIAVLAAAGLGLAIAFGAAPIFFVTLGLMTVMAIFRVVLYAVERKRANEPLDTAIKTDNEQLNNVRQEAEFAETRKQTLDGFAERRESCPEEGNDPDGIRESLAADWAQNLSIISTA